MTNTRSSWAERGPLDDVAARRLLQRVARQWWLIGLCAVVAALAAFAVSSARTKQYDAVSTIEVGTIDLVSVYLADSVQVQDTDPERLVAGAVEQFNLPNVRDRAVEQIGGQVTSGQLETAVSVVNTPDSSVLKVHGRSSDPKQAQAISNAMVNAFIKQRETLARKKVVEAKQTISRQFKNLSEEERSSSTGQILQSRLREVGVLGTLSDGNVTVIQGAREPTDAVAPRPKRDAILGLLAGLLLGTGVALLRARLDDRMRESEELSELWDLPVVGLVPQDRSLRESGASVPGPAALEALSLARTNLRYLKVGGAIKTVLITSAEEAEGKSTITWNLAVAMGLAGTNVLVIEADLRRPKLTPRLGLAGPGLSEVLAGIADLDDAIHTLDIADDRGTATTVDVIAAGMVPPSPIALLEGEKTSEVLAELRRGYDVVLIDTPPATIVADALTISDNVDAVLVVSRLAVVQRRSYRRLRDLLVGVGAPVIGQVINSDAAANSYGYYASAGAEAKPAKVAAGAKS